MPSINLDNLERYDSKARNEAEEEYMPKDSGNWQKTEKAGAVAFYPVGGSPLEGKVKFSFTETPPAEGDKGPENPSSIAGVSSIAVGKCGKNVMPKNTATYNGYGVTISYNSDSCLVLNGTYTDTTNQCYYANVDGSSLFGDFTPCSVRLDTTKSYKFWAKLVSGSVTGSLHFLIGNKSHQITIGTGNWSTGLVVSATIPAGYCEFFTIRTDLNVGASYSNAVLQMQLEEGTEITDFEPPMSASEIKTSIPLGDTYYGGEINLATGLMTVTHEGHVFDGTERWRTVSNSNGTNFRHDLASSNYQMNRHAGSGVCSHFQTTANNMFRYYASGMFGDMFFVVIEDPNAVYGTNDAWLSFLAAQKANGTPVTICYALYEPYTVQLSPLALSALAQTDKCTPRLNTVYTDADAIQIGYTKSPQRTEQELTQAILEIESDDSD